MTPAGSNSSATAGVSSIPTTRKPPMSPFRHTGRSRTPAPALQATKADERLDGEDVADILFYPQVDLGDAGPRYDIHIPATENDIVLEALPRHRLREVRPDPLGLLKLPSP